MSKVRVKNDNKFIVGIRYDDGTNREINFRGGQIRVMEEIDVMNVDAVSQLFKRGVLTIIEEDERVEELGIDTNNVNALTFEDAAEIIKLNSATMKNRLEKITARHAQEKIIQAAKSLKDELSHSKIKHINDILEIDIMKLIDEDSEQKEG